MSLPTLFWCCVARPPAFAGSIGGTYTKPLLVVPEVMIGALGKFQLLPRYDAKNNVVRARVFCVSCATRSWSPRSRLRACPGRQLSHDGVCWCAARRPAPVDGHGGDVVGRPPRRRRRHRRALLQRVEALPGESAPARPARPARSSVALSLSRFLLLLPFFILHGDAHVPFWRLALQEHPSAMLIETK